MADKFTTFATHCNTKYALLTHTLYSVVVNVATNDEVAMAHIRCAMGAKFGSMALAPWDTDDKMERSNALYVDEMREAVERVRVLTGLDRETVRLAMMVFVSDVIENMQSAVSYIEA